MRIRRIVGWCGGLALIVVLGCTHFAAGSRGVAAGGPAPLRDSAAAAGGTVRWLVISDIHFDPFADPALVRPLISAPLSAWPALLAAQAKGWPSGYGHDTNAALLASALAAMRRVDADPSVIVVSGDFLAHGFGQQFRKTAPGSDRATYRAFVLKTMDYVAGELHRSFPRAQILPAIGNNDGFCGDYESTPRDPFLAHVARTWAPLVNVAGRAPHFIATFSEGGYYEAGLPHRQMRVIVPNSVFWSARYRDRCDETDANPGDAELKWLADALGRHAAGERTWLVTHIPPGVDTFKTSLRLGTPSLLYEPRAQVRFLAALNDGGSEVTAMIAGHLHDTWFRQSAAGSSRGVPILIAPSLSPIFGNDPSFLELQVSPRTAQIVDVRAYSFGGLLGAYGRAPVWHEEYDANAAYGMRGLTPTSLADLHRRERSVPALRRALGRNAASNGIARLVTQLDWRSSWCAETALTREAFVACRGSR